MAPRSLTQKILAAHGATPEGDTIALIPRQVLVQEGMSLTMLKLG